MARLSKGAQFNRMLKEANKARPNTLKGSLAWVDRCLSDDTEILTKNGWKRYTEIQEGQEIRCFDMVTDRFIWQPILEVIVCEYHDTAYRIESEHTDQIVTRHHRCLVKRSDSEKSIEDETEVYPYPNNLSKLYELREAELLAQKVQIPILKFACFKLQYGCCCEHAESDEVAVTPFHFDGIVWCVRVDSGIFVASRNRKVFLTGNSIQDQSTMTALASIRSDFPLQFEIPTRNHSLAYIVQEMYLISSRLHRAVNRLASDVTIDEMADSQPFTVIVNGETGKTRTKIIGKVQELIRRLKIGYKGKEVVLRSLMSGDTVAQPVYELWDDNNYHLASFMTMPSWEMHFDPIKKYWEQRKGANVMGFRPIARWNEVPDYMIRMIHQHDDNRVYGTPLFGNQIVNYRQYLMALEDLAAASRDAAVRKYKFMFGPKEGHWQMDANKLKEFRARMDQTPKNILQNFYLLAGMEDMEVLKGDAAGVKELMDDVKKHEQRILADLGLPPDPIDMKGQRNQESVDANYSMRINDIRMEYVQFVIMAIDKGLLLEGYSDVDMSLMLPPVLEAPSVRDKRAMDQYNNSGISWDRCCAIRGIKDPSYERALIEHDIKWKQDMQIPPYSFTARLEDISKNGTDGPSESPDKGAAPEGGRERRDTQKKAGKKNPTGV